METNKREIKETEEDIVVEMLQQKVNEKVNVDIVEESNKLTTESIIKNANNKFLLDVLSPEIRENEKKKRKHKDWLMVAMGCFLFLQFVVVMIMVFYSGYWIVKSHITQNPFSDSTIQLIFTFISAYITSVIIELIAILRYIVKNVFDTSIAGMVNKFSDNDTTKNK